MINLEKHELLEIDGGAISGTLISAFVKGINSLLDLGRSLGTAIRRVKTNNICPL